MNINDVVDKLNQDGHKLLYLCVFGSHLYGTNSENSDMDYKGIFLPSRRSCILGTSPKSYTWNSKENSNEKNTSEDIDVQLWSLQYFLKLLGQGETNAIDLLYSMSYKKMVIFFQDGIYDMEYLFKNHKRLFSVKDTKSFVGYSIGQSKKYGVKGSRLGVIKRVLEFLDRKIAQNNNLLFELESLKIFQFKGELLSACGNDSFCFIKDCKGSNEKIIPYLFLCGSKHDLTINFKEFYKRVKNTYDIYGERAKAAEKNEGIDFKALSHAVRALRQMEMLLEEGEIRYPLDCAEELKEIKYGKKTWNEIEKIIVEGLNNVEILQNKISSEHKLDQTFVENFILNNY
jgi:hypothetical protein